MVSIDNDLGKVVSGRNVQITSEDEDSLPSRIHDHFVTGASRRTSLLINVELQSPYLLIITLRRRQPRLIPGANERAS